MTSGSAQRDRRPPALDPESILLDETPLHDLLAMTRDYAAHLTFVGADGKPAARWNELLDRDSAVLMARLASLRVDDHRDRLVDDFNAGRSGKMRQNLEELAGWLQDWFAALGRIEADPDQALSARLRRHVLRGLAPELANLTGKTPVTSVYAFHENLRGWLGASSPAASSAEAPEHLRTLRRLYAALLEALDRLRSEAEDELKALLVNKRHEPAAALLLAIAQVVQPVRARVNGFTGRLLDFYYKECLGFVPREGRLDSAHVVVERDRGFAGDVVIPKGQSFIVGQAPDGSSIAFAAETQLSVSDARVAQLKTLRLERDPLISPECEFGYVTRARAATYAPRISADSRTAGLPAALLGGSVLGCAAIEEDARLGLAVSSPILWLMEGERHIDLTLEIETTLPDLRKTLDTAIKDLSAARAKKDTLAAAKHKDTFRRALGDMFAAWILNDAFVLNDADVAEIRRSAYDLEVIAKDRLGEGTETEGRTLPDDIAIFVAHDLLAMMLGPVNDADETGPQDAADRDELRARRRKLARDEFFASAFKVEVSTQDGWFPVPSVEPSHRRPEHTTTSGFLRLVLDLGVEDPAVVACTPQIHGEEWPTDHPVVRLTANPQCRLFPLSVLSNPTISPSLSAVAISVKVDGVQTLQAYNHQGQLDPTKPFQPFGPLPNTSSYMVIGSPEAARKSITRHELTFAWSGLPPEGFEDHYAGYGADPPLREEAFQVQELILRDGRWAEGGPEQPLFTRDVAGRPLACALVLGAAPLRANWRPTFEPLVYDQNARCGFVKVQLAAPRAGFGHQLYPAALTNALRPPPRGKAPPPLPNPPYSPTLDRVTLAYSAETRIVPGEAPQSDPERVLLIHPFGVRAIRPAATEGPHPVFPILDGDGQLLIGLSAVRLEDELSLLFELCEEVAVEALARQDLEPGPPGARDTAAGEGAARLGAKPHLQWSVLADNRWRSLDRGRIVDDSTRGFLTSGIVRLDLPPGLATGSSVLPAAHYWLRLSADALSGSFAGLQAVSTQAVLVKRVPASQPPDDLAPLSITSKSATIPGLVSITQPMPGFGLRARESEVAARTRIAERLRHKDRATTPWDYERLVLDAYPGVQKVRCLSNVDPVSGDARPGSVLVVVVPAPPHHEPGYETRPLQLSALELDAIAGFLPRHASPFARVAVRNVQYEFIQVRCRVGLRRGAQIGDALRRINSRLVSFLSPWCEGGYAADFDWAIRGDDIEACIRKVDDVESVAGVSLIRVWEDNRSMPNPLYEFEDTAILGQTSGEVAVVTHSRPWSLALPLPEHFIEVLSVGDVDLRPHGTGIAATGDEGVGLAPGLQIGETFIIGGVR